MASTIPHRLAIFLLAFAAASILVLAARAESVPDGEVAVVAYPAGGGLVGGGGDDGLITVFLPSGEGFSDGGDIPEGMVAALAERAGEGFSDGGDVPAGFIVVFAQPAPEGFSDGGDVPEGMIAVRAQPAGFSDGGDVPMGFVAVALEPLASGRSFSPPGG